ncbi:hypothetical protein Nepgr_002192 [Nepenthes gracilis]|uniref:Uncharacterized protein n=1 Tax=Nepenthes gracilis TaxID=150966 RepID=A0AAD3P8H2_NEPGR|nr:hypothetical protein Nepgr_002192 [Nepenthes gracilis]
MRCKSTSALNVNSICGYSSSLINNDSIGFPSTGGGRCGGGCAAAAGEGKRSGRHISEWIRKRQDRWDRWRCTSLDSLGRERAFQSIEAFRTPPTAPLPIHPQRELEEITPKPKSLSNNSSVFSVSTSYCKIIKFNA